MSLFNRFKKSEKGQGLVEYGLILALVSVVAVGSLGGVGDKVSNTFKGVDKVLDSGIYSEEEIDNLIANENYIPIATADELNNIRNVSKKTFGKGTDWEKSYSSGMDKKYIQVSNISLSKFDNWVPIGSYVNDFKGDFDGGGYRISGLRIYNLPDDHDGNDDEFRHNRSDVGLFGRVSNATLKNVGLDLVDIDVSGDYNIGGLTGSSWNGSKISNSYVLGNLKSDSSLSYSVGGLVGYHSHSSISSSYSSANILGVNRVGGLVGRQTESLIIDSHATGKVGGDSQIGGLIGYQWSGEIANSYAVGKVSGNSHVGGLLGEKNSGVVKSSAWANDVGSGVNGYGVGLPMSEINKLINNIKLR